MADNSALDRARHVMTDQGYTVEPLTGPLFLAFRRGETVVVMVVSTDELAEVALLAASQRAKFIRAWLEGDEEKEAGLRIFEIQSWTRSGEEWNLEVRRASISKDGAIAFHKVGVLDLATVSKIAAECLVPPLVENFKARTALFDKIAKKPGPMTMEQAGQIVARHVLPAMIDDINSKPTKKSESPS